MRVSNQIRFSQKVQLFSARGSIRTEHVLLVLVIVYATPHL